MKNHQSIYRSPEDDKTPIGGGGGSPRPRQAEVSEEESGDDD